MRLKKTLATVVSCVMLFSLCVVGANADESSWCAALSDDGTYTSGTFTLTSNASLSETLTIPSGETLALNDFGITGTVQMNGGTITSSNTTITGPKDSGAAYITSNATFTVEKNAITIEDGSVELGVDFCTMPNQTLTLGQNASFTIPSGKTLHVYSKVINNGTLTIDGTLNLYTSKESGPLKTSNPTGYSSTPVDGAGTLTNNSTIVVGTSAALTQAVAYGGTIQLDKNITVDVKIPSDRTVTLDLDGHTLTNQNSNTITNNGTLTIEDSATGGTVDNVTNQKAALYNNGTAALASGTFERSKESGTGTGSGGNTYYTVVNHGTMTIETNTTILQSGQYSSLLENGWYNGTQNTGKKESTLTIKGGTFVGGLNTIKNDDYGRLNINGGTFRNTSQDILLNWNVATIAGGTFDASKCTNGVILNGHINDTMDQGQLTITGGNFTGTTILERMNGSGNDGIGTIQISGGTFTCNSAVISTKLATGNSKIEISGGTFSMDPGESYLKEGYQVTNTDGKYMVAQAPALATPTDLAWDTETPAKATWTAVDNASNYTVQLYKGGETSGEAVTANTNSYDFTSAITESGSYTFTVTAVGDKTNYTDSATSAQSVAYSYKSPYTITSIGAEEAGGAGITRTIKTSGTDGHQYLVIQMTEGTGKDAHVYVVMVKAENSVTVSYKTTAVVQVWLTDGMPKLNGLEATGAAVYGTLTATTANAATAD